LQENGIIDAVAYQQLEVFKAAVEFARAEGIVPAPETAHAIKAAIDIVRRHRRQSKCVVFNFSGHGLLDLASYDKFLSGELKNYAYPLKEIKSALRDLPEL
jgi:tryptophan synthase beta chain